MSRSARVVANKQLNKISSSVARSGMFQSTMGIATECANWDKVQRKACSLECWVLEAEAGRFGRAEMGVGGRGGGEGGGSRSLRARSIYYSAPSFRLQLRHTARCFMHQLPATAAHSMHTRVAAGVLWQGLLQGKRVCGWKCGDLQSSKRCCERCLVNATIWYRRQSISEL
jgi:hypothetical protein